MKKGEFWNQQGMQLDASYGLIMRLNYLWQKVDASAEVGNFEKWNYLLDRIFSNLLYKNELVRIRDSKGRIVDAKLDDEDAQLYEVLNKKVYEAKILLKEAIKNKNKQEYQLANSKLYRALMFKDVGIRKFMQELKLYLKQSDSNPARAMWGG